MTKEYGYRRHRPLRVRHLGEEEDFEKYKRLGWDPRKTYEENMSGESLFDRPDEELEWPPVEVSSQQQPHYYEGPEIQEITVAGKPSTIPLNVYPFQKAFFDKFDEPVARLAKQYDLDPEHLLGLFGHESDWGRGEDVIKKNNPFGLNLPGSKQARPFPDLDTAFDYWGKMYGDQLRGIHKTQDFANKLRNLRAGPYNLVDPTYDQKVINTIHTVNVKRPLWKQGW